MSIRRIVKPPFWYQLLLSIITPLYRWRVWQRSRHEADYQAEVMQRFVVQPQAKNTGVIWIHAVSVGETNAAQPLIQHYLDMGLPVLVTNTTRTGQARVHGLFASQYPQQFESVFMPVDSLPLIEKFIAIYQPRLLALIETELWPNLLALCAQQSIPTALMNARLSARSAKGYARFSRLTRPMLQQLNLIAAQDNDTAQRFIGLGAATEAVKTTGSLKFDLHAPEALLAQAAQIKQDWQLAQRPLFVVASTHEPEEKLLLEAFHRLLKDYPNAVLIIAPRHPQRFDSVAQQISAEGYTLYRRSLKQQINPACQVYLADSMGELWLWYALASAAFVGGSLCENGGHNPLEPARLGVPVVMGPHVFNFKKIVEVLADAGALQQADSAGQVVAIWQHWLNQPAQRVQASQAALEVMQANQGALSRQIQALDQLLQASPAS